jgi:peroxiredoxin
LATHFPLLSDTSGAAAKAFATWDEKPEIARVATFLIAKGGQLLYRKVGADKKDRPSVDEVLRATPAVTGG